MHCAKHDVVVIGGGLAGVAAAIAVAREGGDVLLVEKYGFLGGMAVSGLVNPFMPYWEHETDGKPLYDKPVNGGIFRLITQRLTDMHAFDITGKMTFHEEYLKLVLDRLCREYGVKTLFHTLLTEVQCAERQRNERQCAERQYNERQCNERQYNERQCNERQSADEHANNEHTTVKAVTIANKGGIGRLEAELFIDASGDADLTAFAGFAAKIGREEDGLCQPMTLCFRVANVDVDKWDRAQATRLYQAMQKQGRIKNKREDILTFPTMIDNVVHFNSTRIIGRNPIDAAELTAAEMEAREQVHELFTFMKEQVPGFENAALLMSAPQIGVRESRRIVGDVVITEEDLLACRKFTDSIARGTYTIDIHNPAGTGTVRKWIPAHDYYTIPLGAAIPSGSDNLMVAGRPLSSTHEAHSAFRVMPIAASIGEGVGCAASIALHRHITPRQVDAASLHTMMDRYAALY